ncbi:hypothetical protein [Enterobacter hormaechei]|uniref:hypothetical protein n=3 Tax=Enterobacter TaxID=547 RepID=UPI002074B241|nr:hypothetical protein [Enterobacter hormaechei]MCM7887994.1 hypothetical protein [Enterobacter hormaechei]MCM7892646.1 hypothetical protein [Enterobacter hormaechei]MCM7901993.1 hypothetical protein [Enterobacter hormaechei]MCM7911202.1 hypothetical protein [Enterobacter hormaechei]MDF3590232.1 hypothetical protein [Enterobacter hormaechei]
MFVDFYVDLFFDGISDMLQKTSKRDWVMDLDEERVNMMAHAAGRAVMELSLADLPVTQQAIIDKLEQYRKETGNVIGKGINRDAAEIVRSGRRALK